MYKHLDLETVLQDMPKLTSRYTRAFEYEEKRDGSRTVIVLRHGSGHKYSLFYEEVARALFADLGGRGIRTEPQENAVVLEFSNPPKTVAAEDRKSTRLNSSHVAISYAVFCLKKKKKVH